MEMERERKTWREREERGYGDEDSLFKYIHKIKSELQGWTERES